MVKYKDPYGRTEETIAAWAEIKPEDRQEMEVAEIAKVRGMEVNRFINAGRSSIILPASAESGGSGHGSRLDPGDFVDGAYYEKCLKHAQGLMRLCFVDDKLLDDLAKQKRIRDGEEFPDWVKEAKSQLDKEGGTKAKHTEQFMENDPVDRLAQVQAEGRPHASEER